MGLAIGIPTRASLNAGLNLVGGGISFLLSTNRNCICASHHPRAQALRGLFSNIYLIDRYVICALLCALPRRRSGMSQASITEHATFQMVVSKIFSCYPLIRPLAQLSAKDLE